MLGFIGSIKENTFLQWIGIGFGIGLSTLELLFIFFVKYLKESEVKSIVEQGLTLIKKFNESFGKELNVNCNLHYNLGIGMKLIFDFPLIYFEINLISSLDNLS